MKSNTLLRTASGVLALGMAAGLAGCGATADTTEATAESAVSSTAESTDATTETADDAYAYLADFSFSAPFDENGYLADVKAADFVTLPEDFDGLTIPAEANTVAAEDITTYINDNLLANYSTTAQVTDRAAADGDTVNIDYAGSIDGVAFDGGTSAGYDLTLGSGSFIDGFEDQIVGHTPGENFDINVTFPESYGSADLAGKDAVFNITFNYISEDSTPELTDAWVAENLKDSLSVENVAALNQYVSDTLLFNQQSNEVYSQLLDGATVAEELPADLNEYLQNQQLYSVYRYATMYGTDLNTMLTSGGYGSVDEYLSGISSNISSMGNQILLMQAAAESLGMTCDTDALNANFASYFGSDDIASYSDTYGENFLKMNLLHNLVMQRLIDDATKA